MDYTPDLHVLESRRNDRLGWHDCLAELIDNSFDAGATRAELVFGPKSFAVHDDGCGTNDVASMVRIGSHRRRRSTSLGQYGVGLKDAWLWLSDSIEIRSTTDTETAILSVNIKQLEQIDGKWVGPDPVLAEKAGDRGTRIVFSPLRPNRGLPQQDGSVNRLGLTFMPALLSGKQIVVTKAGKRTPVQAYKIPPMCEAVEESFDIGGKRVSISIGIAQEGERISEPGFCLLYGHRLIRMTSTGTGDFSSSRMVGSIRLGDGWKVTPHKNDLSDYSDELEIEIHSRIRHLLEKNAQMSDSIESDKLRTELASMINSAMSSAKTKGREKRGGSSHPGTGTIAAKSTAKQRKTAGKISPDLNGAVSLRSDGETPRRSGLSIDWHDFPDDENTIGRCEIETGKITLNTNNDFIRSSKRDGNKRALYAVAVGLFCHRSATWDGPQKMAFEVKDFMHSWGTVIASLQFEETANATG